MTHAGEHTRAAAQVERESGLRGLPKVGGESQKKWFLGSYFKNLELALRRFTCQPTTTRAVRRLR